MTADATAPVPTYRKRVCDHRWASSERCTAPAMWQMVYDDVDAAACGRHLNAVLLLITESGWVKVDRLWSGADSAARGSDV